MEDRFNKEKSLELKGVAIIFMFWLHFFIAPNYVTSEKRMIRTHFKEEKLFEIKRLMKRVQSKVR